MGRAIFVRQKKRGLYMSSYNSKFELSVEDMDLIETALRQTKADLSGRSYALVDGFEHPEEALRKVDELLGRLHNQKVFYRPRRGAYIGG
ncbi:hypothetical protein ROS217_04680 [Roseovarius sp. 217]|nr:hypothetical protein ROS217_04680 [Roseovarius sp. 217]